MLGTGLQPPTDPPTNMDFSKWKQLETASAARNLLPAVISRASVAHPAVTALCLGVRPSENGDRLTAAFAVARARISVPPACRSAELCPDGLQMWAEVGFGKSDRCVMDGSDEAVAFAAAHQLPSSGSGFEAPGKAGLLLRFDRTFRAKHWAAAEGFGKRKAATTLDMFTLEERTAQVVDLQGLKLTWSQKWGFDLKFQAATSAPDAAETSDYTLSAEYLQHAGVVGMPSEADDDAGAKYITQPLVSLSLNSFFAGPPALCSEFAARDDDRWEIPAGMGESGARPASSFFAGIVAQKHCSDGETMELNPLRVVCFPGLQEPQQHARLQHRLLLGNMAHWLAVGKTLLRQKGLRLFLLGYVDRQETARLVGSGAPGGCDAKAMKVLQAIVNYDDLFSDTAAPSCVAVSAPFARKLFAAADGNKKAVSSFPPHFDEVLRMNARGVRKSAAGEGSYAATPEASAKNRHLNNLSALKAGGKHLDAMLQEADPAAQDDDAAPDDTTLQILLVTNLLDAAAAGFGPDPTANEQLLLQKAHPTTDDAPLAACVFARLSPPPAAPHKRLRT